MTDYRPLKDVVKRMRCRGRKVVYVLSLLETDWPSTEAVFDNLVRYINEESDQTDANEILQTIIEQALERYYQVTLNEECPVDDATRLGVFLEALISETCSVTSIGLEADDGGVWDAGCADTFTDWFTNHKGNIVAFPLQEEAATRCRAYLYEVIVTEKLKNLMRSTQHEQAILAGNFAASH